MASPADIFIHCDDLENIPALARENYIREHDLLVDILPPKAHVLQVGSMDGMRAVRLLQARPDLALTGLEIEEPLVVLARKNLAAAGLTATFIHGDITQPPSLPTFDYVLCLNNTLGYIPDQATAIQYMKQLGNHMILSVFGERFNNKLAEEYFASIGLALQSMEDNICTFKDFSKVYRYTKKQVVAWGGEVAKTPLGYLCVS